MGAMPSPLTANSFSVVSSSTAARGRYAHLLGLPAAADNPIAFEWRECQAVMASQVTRTFGLAGLLQIGVGSIKLKPAGANALSDEARVFEHASSNREVDAFLNQVDESIRYHDLDVDLWVARHEAAEKPGQQVNAQPDWHRHRGRSLWFAPASGRAGLCSFDIADGSLTRFEEGLAFCREA